MVTADFDLVTPPSWRSSVPETPENWPFTFEIIMCLTLNSATERAGSMAQALAAVCGAVAVVAVDMESAPFASFGLDALPRYSLQRILQETNLGLPPGDPAQLQNTPHPPPPPAPHSAPV